MDFNGRGERWGKGLKGKEEMGVEGRKEKKRNETRKHSNKQHIYLYNNYNIIKPYTVHVQNVFSDSTVLSDAYF